jgi:pimeloyl-[acyl-carrier protein] methyl ester esterase
VTCIFVHGWAMNSAVWDDCIKRLPDWIDVIVVDLPGHGTMIDKDAESLEDYVQSLVPLAHHPVIWVGWSLGGLAVLRLVEMFPERVAAALLVSTNPCFVTRSDWQHAVEKSVFLQFAENLQRDQEKTIQRFIALQVKGASGVMDVVRRLQKSLSARGSASFKALNSGLNVLLESDLRQNLQYIDSPLHWSFGGMDGLVPEDLADTLRNEFKQEHVVVYEKASHAPFISHTEEFLQQLLSIAEDVRDQVAS